MHKLDANSLLVRVRALSILPKDAQCTANVQFWDVYLQFWHPQSAWSTKFGGILEGNGTLMDESTTLNSGWTSKAVKNIHRVPLFALSWKDCAFTSKITLLCHFFHFFTSYKGCVGGHRTSMVTQTKWPWRYLKTCSFSSSILHSTTSTSGYSTCNFFILFFKKNVKKTENNVHRAFLPLLQVCPGMYPSIASTVIMFMIKSMRTVLSFIYNVLSVLLLQVLLLQVLLYVQVFLWE